MGQAQIRHTQMAFHRVKIKGLSFCVLENLLYWILNIPQGLNLTVCPLECMNLNNFFFYYFFSMTVPKYCDPWLEILI